MAISTNVEAQRKIDEEIEVHMVVVRRLLKRRNTYSAVYQLPNEILAEFFILATADDWMITDNLLNLASVCAQWRQICLATPQLWTIICFEHPRWCAELLSRAQGCPLNIYLWGRYGRNSDEDLERAASVLVTATSRFTKVDIREVDYNADTAASSFLRRSFALPAPLLQDVIMTMKPGTILGNLWPELISLRSLHLNNALPMTTSLMPNLVNLRINNWEYGNHLSVPWLIDLLRNTPRIETVDIQEVSSPSPFVVVGVLPISLAHLQSLSISMSGFRELKLFSSLELPAATNIWLNIVTLTDETSRETNFALLQSLIARWISHASPSLDVRVVDGHHSDTTSLGVGVVDGADNDICSLCLVFPTRQLNRVDLVASLPLRKIHKLKIQCPMEDEEALAWSEKIPLFSKLRELHVDTVAFLQSVAVVPSASFEHQSGRFIHRELEEISISWDYQSTARDWAQFLRVCQSHHERGTRLQLRISGCDIPISYGKALKAYTELDWDERGSDALVEPFEELPSANE